MGIVTMRDFFFETNSNLKVGNYTRGVLFLRNIVRAELSARYEGVLDGESYMDTVTIDRIVGVDISEG